MTTYTAPVDDTKFVLFDFLDVSNSDIPGYADLDEDLVSAILNEAGKVAAEVVAPLNATGDAEGCTFDDGRVTTPAGFREAFEHMGNGGWIGLDADPEYGGQGLPSIIYSATGEYFTAANMALQMYSGLSHGAAFTIEAHGTEEQKARFLPKVFEGKWSGTMNLTEPQCGTDLGLIKTMATPQDDGSYRVSGTKIFISSGEHDLTENIIHLVLARTPDAPEGIKGLSLFIVPKVKVNDDGTLGSRNHVRCGGIEDKMGIHANSTCVMNYDGAQGYLLGDLHKGMRAMFTMMNEARLSVGMQAYAQGELAYQNALEFARDRLQGRDVTGAQNPEAPADPIIVHPDVRRILMDVKSVLGGARALTLWGGKLIDRARRADDKDAEDMISLLTPVIKGFLTYKGLEATIAAQQVLGGSGFIRDWGMEQIVRDTRITLIYEGANGVQALDLVGRKLPKDGGAAMISFVKMVKEFCIENRDHALAQDVVEPLKAASKDLQTATEFFVSAGMKDPNNALAGSSDFLNLFGHVTVAFMWAQMCIVAHAKKETGTLGPNFYETKITTGRYYMARQLPATKMHLARILSGAETVMAIDAEDF